MPATKFYRLQKQFVQRLQFFNFIKNLIFFCVSSNVISIWRISWSNRKQSFTFISTILKYLIFATKPDFFIIKKREKWAWPMILITQKAYTIPPRVSTYPWINSKQIKFSNFELILDFSRHFKAIAAVQISISMIYCLIRCVIYHPESSRMQALYDKGMFGLVLFHD